MVLVAGRVGVDPADEVLARRLDPAADDDVLAGQDERAAVRRLLDPGRSGSRPSPPRRWRTPSSASIPDGTQGLTRRPSLTLAAPASNQVPGESAKPVPSSQTQRSACSVPQLWPIIPGQPAIVDRASRRPPACPRRPRRGTGRRTSSAAAAPRRASRRAGSGRARCRRRSAATRWPTARRRRPSPPPPPARSRRRRRGSTPPAGTDSPLAGTVTLVARGAGRVAIEEREPDRAGRLLPGPLVDGVADPDPEAAVGPARLHVEALVMARLRGDLPEARPFLHGASLTGPTGILAGRPVRLAPCREHAAERFVVFGAARARGRASPSSASSTSCCRAPRSTSCRTSANSSATTPARPHTQEYLWLSLGFAYMVVITGLCVIAQADVVRYRPLLLLLAAGKAASSLTSLAFFLIQDHVFAYLLGALVDGSLILAALWLYVLAGRIDRPLEPGGARRPASATRRTADPERDLRGDGAGDRRPARGRARGRRLRPGRRLPARRPAPPAAAAAPRPARLRVAALPAPLQPPRPARPRTLPRASSKARASRSNSTCC